MDLDDQLEAMRAAWRDASVGDLSISQLRAQVRQEQGLLRREAWLEVLASLAAGLEALASLAASAVFAV